MSEVITSILLAFITALVPVVGIVLKTLGQKAAELIQAKVDNQTAEAALLRLTAAVTDAVGEVYQAEAGALKGAAADGKLTQEEKDRLKQIAVDHAKSYLGKKGVDMLLEVLGFTSEKDLDKVIAGKVDKVIYDAKRAGLNRIEQTTAAL